MPVEFTILRLAVVAAVRLLDGVEGGEVGGREGKE